MKFDFIPPSLDWEYRNSIDTCSTSEIVESVDSAVKKYVDTAKDIEKIINSNGNNITEKDFVDYVKRMFNIELNEKEYLEIFSKAHNKDFIGYDRINTYMIEKGINT